MKKSGIDSANPGAGSEKPGVPGGIHGADLLFGRWRIMTRILLYSDEHILAKGLESVLRQVEGFELLPTCNTVPGVIQQVASGAPDLVLLDLTPEITFAVLSEMKHAMANTRIVLWVNSISTELA